LTYVNTAHFFLRRRGQIKGSNPFGRVVHELALEAEAMRRQQGVGHTVLAAGKQLKESALISGHRVASKREPRNRGGA
jgi:hypothetical protein